jgi:hypothetical protein
MLAYFAINLILSTIVASQPLVGHHNEKNIPFMSTRDCPVPSCGLLLDDDRVGNIMQKNGQYSSITKKAISLSLHKGCLCALLSTPCAQNDGGSWSWLGFGRHEDYNLTHHKDIKWYQCFIELSGGQVSSHVSVDVENLI